MATSKHRPSPEIRLKRFLYINSEEPRYITGNPEKHDTYIPEKLQSVLEVMRSNNAEQLLNIVEIVNSESTIPRRNNLLFALALAASTTQLSTLKHRIFTTLLNLINNAEDLCTFLKYYTKQKKKFSSALVKTIRSYYVKKDPIDLAHEIVAAKGYHSWTHKDLIKLSHPRCESVLGQIVTGYILFGLPKAKVMAENNEAAAQIIDLFTKVEEMKRTESEPQIVKLISELHCDITRVPSIFHRSQPVWEALLPDLSPNDLLVYLPRMYKLGFLKANTPFQTKAIEILTNAEKIQGCKIHPIEVFIGLKNFEKGGKPMDPKFQDYLETTWQDKEKVDPNFKKPEVASRDPPKCPNIISALHKAMQISFQNLQAMGRKIMITIDVTERMNNPCLSTRNVTCLEAAAILTLSILRVEKDVTIAVFNETKISFVSFEKNITFNQAIVKLKQARSGYCTPSSPIEWARNKKKPIDVFIHLLGSNHIFPMLPKEIREKEKPIESLIKYRKKMSLPHAKLIAFSLSSPKPTLADGSLNILDICGFSKEVPKVLEAFCKGLFY